MTLTVLGQHFEKYGFPFSSCCACYSSIYCFIAAHLPYQAVYIYEKETKNLLKIRLVSYTLTERFPKKEVFIVRFIHFCFLFVSYGDWRENIVLHNLLYLLNVFEFVVRSCILSYSISVRWIYGTVETCKGGAYIIHIALFATFIHGFALLISLRIDLILYCWLSYRFLFLSNELRSRVSQCHLSMYLYSIYYMYLLIITAENGVVLRCISKQCLIPHKI